MINETRGGMQMNTTKWTYSQGCCKDFLSSAAECSWYIPYYEYNMKRYNVALELKSWTRDLLHKKVAIFQ